MQPSPPAMPSPAPPLPAKRGLSPIAILMICLGALFLIIIVISALAGLVAPLVLRQRSKAEQTVAISNARTAGLVLMNFEFEYGRFPDAKTAALVAEKSQSDLAPAGTSANDHLRQLIAAGFVHSELIFYSKAAFSRQPDNDLSNARTALAPGEVGFGYLLNGTTGLNSDNPSGAVILCAPLAMDGSKVSSSRFDPAIFDGKAVMLHIDQSVRYYSIDRITGEVLIEGKPWLATGDGTAWGTELAPQVAVPDPK